MTRLGKFWTSAVAYVSLLVGAGLSVAGNLADTYRIRGTLTDAVDIVLAVGPPIASLLVAELFVSAWPRKLSVQAIRWAGTISVGLLATVVSWLHINELLSARGQLTLVAILWPLAIDGLAIMAMAKILVTRGHVAMATFTPLATDADGHVATGHGQEVAIDQLAMAKNGQWTGPVATEEDVAISEAAFRGHVATPNTRIEIAKDLDAMATLRADIDAWEKGGHEAIGDAGQELAAEAQAFLAPVRTASSVPDDARQVIESWDGPTEDLDAYLVDRFGKSARTARRWRAIVAGRPVSGA